MNKTQNEILEVPLKTSFVLERDQSQSNKGILILHGFTDHAQSARRRLIGTNAIPNQTIFAPNALFPSPLKKDSEYKEAYAWYYRDFQTKMQMISPEFAAEMLIKLINKLELINVTWKIIGFSQGGFFAPHLVHAGLKTEKIIAVGAAFLKESYQKFPTNIPIHGIHGEQDAVVPFHFAKSTFEKLSDFKLNTQFHAISNLGHTLNDEGRKIIANLIL